MPGPKSPKVHTLQTAVEAARKYCAYQERCQKEVRDKLYTLGLHRQEVEQGITILIEENFLNEERYATAFARGKFRIKKWGKVKIKMELKKRDIGTWCINNALKQIDFDEYLSELAKLKDATSQKIKEKVPVKKNFMIAKYLISRGYEPELVWEALKTTD